LSKAIKKKGGSERKQEYATLSILSTRRQDWIIAGIGAVLAIAGILFYRNVIPFEWGHTYWYILVAVGILAFSWMFR
jgi:hypothetical protein